MSTLDPHNIIGKEVPAADGMDYGHRVLSFNPDTGDYTVQSIRWSTGEPVGSPGRISWFKIGYRYKCNEAREDTLTVLIRENR